jgi:hypothetical protein
MKQKTNPKLCKWKRLDIFAELLKKFRDFSGSLCVYSEMLSL